MDINSILTIVGLVCALLATIVTAISKNCKNSKIAKKATSLLTIIESAQQFIEQAEKMTGFTGENKKEWVVTKICQFCISKNINYDEETIDNVVEELISFSKQVNSDKK